MARSQGLKLLCVPLPWDLDIAGQRNSPPQSLETETLFAMLLPPGVQQLALPRRSDIVDVFLNNLEFFGEVCFINTMIIVAIIKTEPWFQRTCLWRQWVGSSPLYGSAFSTLHPLLSSGAASQLLCVQLFSFLKGLTRLIHPGGQSPERGAIRQEPSEEQIKVAISVKIAGCSP